MHYGSEVHQSGLPQAEGYEQHFESHAIAANRYNMRAQDLTQRDLNRAGGLKGSHPVNGGYLTWRYPNWATKFFADALMLELRPDVSNLG